MRPGDDAVLSLVNIKPSDWLIYSHLAPRFEVSPCLVLSRACQPLCAISVGDVSARHQTRIQNNMFEIYSWQYSPSHLKLVGVRQKWTGHGLEEGRGLFLFAWNLLVLSIYGMGGVRSNCPKYSLFTTYIFSPPTLFIFPEPDVTKWQVWHANIMSASEQHPDDILIALSVSLFDKNQSMFSGVVCTLDPCLSH